MDEPETTCRTIAYGDHAAQVGDLHLPSGLAPGAGWPVAVTIHGGFWLDQYERDLMTPLAEDLARRGVAAWNIEYRRIPPDGASPWPLPLTDVAAAVDATAADPELAASVDARRVALVGHSAGGQLALWATGRGQLPPGVPGAGPKVLPRAAVGLAPLADLLAAAAEDLGDGAVTTMVGGDPDDVPDRWATADPIRLVGHGVPTLLVHGSADQRVPAEQTRRYAAAARAVGDDVAVEIDEGGHRELTDPTSSLWERAAAWLTARLI